VMLVAPFQLTRAVLPGMKRRRWGRIVNIGSIHGLIASPFKSAYVSAKHGLVGLTKTTALEVAEHGITVNAICPAYVRTPLVEAQVQEQARIHGLEPSAVIPAVMLQPAAIKRLIESHEVAEFAWYLTSDAAQSITGSALTMDLGWTAR
jgi:3-hydroxybutyrate dehydrogenase